MITITNFSSVQVNKDGLKKYSSKIIDNDYNIEIVFVGKDEIKKLNKKYRNINSQTDVLTFTDEKKDSLHQIIICPEVAMKNCRIYKNTFDKELKLLIFHGWKHISGNHHL